MYRNENVAFWSSDSALTTQQNSVSILFLAPFADGGLRVMVAKMFCK